MLQHLLDLFELQKIDVGIRDLQKRLEEIPNALRLLETSASGTRVELEKTMLEHDTVNRELNELEGTLQAETIKIRKWESRLNDIRNQREYLALSREVESAKRTNRDAEEKITASKARRTELEKKLETLKGEVGEQESSAAGEREKIQAQLEETRQQLEAETARRRELLPKLPKPVLGKYDAIRQKRMGVGIVQVVGGCCQGCNMRLPPQLFNTLQRGQSIEQCPSCQRIIFWDNHLAQAKSAADPVEAVT